MKRLKRNWSKQYNRIISTTKILRIALILLFVLLYIGLRAQQTYTSDSKNSFFIDVNYYPKGENKASKFLFIANYYRILFSKNIFDLKGQIGLGLFNRSQGDVSGLYGIVNLRAFVKSYFGNETHKLFFGLGGQAFYRHLEILLATGYQINLNRTISLNLAISHWLWHRYSFANQFWDGSGPSSIIEKSWVWSEELNDFFIVLGLGFNF